MEAAVVERIIAGLGSLVVGFYALKALVEEWKKTALEDQVTKIMMVLLTIGSIIVLGVALGQWGRV